MSGMLASVNSLEEALQVLQAGVDIIDLKQPAAGALGALDTATVETIVSHLKNTCPVSATVGDLPLHADIVYSAVEKMAQTGVDYIKVGFFPKGNASATLSKLAKLTQQNHRLIAVLFADTEPDFSLIYALKDAGFYGVMLDTQNKQLGSLTQLMNQKQIKDFICKAKQSGLITGLAGSLRQSDIPQLLTLQADYLGFRGALCRQHNRTAPLDDHAINQIKSAMLKNLETCD